MSQLHLIKLGEMMRLNFEPAQFLIEHWQKSPCFIQQGISPAPAYLSAESLAGISLEDEAESRIVIQNGDDWQIQHGPFSDEDFQSLPPSHWTLLVQTIEQWHPEIQALSDAFSFIPRWRFDDVMLSYATDEGGVGPHFDNYDVFLIQGDGRRRWRVGAMGDVANQNSLYGGLKHIDYFEPIIDVVMQPGDILYIPPNTPHWGISVGDSIGYSVGYRSPQTKDLFAILADYFETEGQSQFFTDPYREEPNYSSKLEPELIQWAKESIAQIANNHALIERLLSQQLSQNKFDWFQNDHDPVVNQLQTQQNLTAESNKQSNTQSVRLNPILSRNWYTEQQRLYLSIDGQLFEFPLNFKKEIQILAAGEPMLWPKSQNSKEDVAFLDTLTSIKNIGYFLYN